MLRIDSLEIARPAFRLGPLSLEISKGEYFVLLGPSGAGKTTFLEWVAGFNRARKGTLWIGGQDQTHATPQQRELGIVYQDSALFPHLSVRENLAFPLRMQGWNETKTRVRVEELADLLHISHRLEAGVKAISGGEGRRVAMGRALAAGRKVLLLDEPLSGLDPDLRRELRFELGALHSNLGLTVVHITHHLGEARALADRIGVLIAGKLEQVGPPEEVFEHPADQAVAEFLTIPNFLEGEGDPGSGVLRVDGKLAIPAPVKSEGRLRARIQNLKLEACSNGSHSIQGVFRGFDRPDDGRVLAAVALAREGNRRPLVLQVDVTQESLPELTPGTEVQVDFSQAEWELY